ncbi:Rrf2 family transcriptional regulator [bacterium]|nr:Rrf2 family transcriptional regulator [bacterium]
MLKLTKKIEYALIALQHMQRKDHNDITNAKEIAENFDLPASLLAKVLQQMAKHDIIEPIQGPSGGYRLSKPLDKIKLNDFIEIIEGPVGLVDCLHDPDCSHIGTCNIRLPIERVNNTIKDLFSNMTLADITK